MRRLTPASRAASRTWKTPRRLLGQQGVDEVVVVGRGGEVDEGADALMARRTAARSVRCRRRDRGSRASARGRSLGWDGAGQQLGDDGAADAAGGAGDEGEGRVMRRGSGGTAGRGEAGPLGAGYLLPYGVVTRAARSRQNS